MEFGSEESHVTKAKLIPFSHSPSSSSSPSSSFHNQITPSWLSSAKLESMDTEEQEQQEPAGRVEKEHMFDKVVTPSDVGKLNRLVIPKQHAERYFPLDSTVNEKGLLLNFEDRCGKAWRFRYSYWNSSQSYVMTKGWSRFVKDKKLDAGDIVSFQRGIGDSGKDRFFIDWRRRPDSAADHRSYHHFQPQQRHYLAPIPWSPLLMQPPAAIGRSSSFGYNGSNSGTIVYMRSVPPQMVQWPGGGGGGVVEPVVYESVPVVEGKSTAAKRLRLFGVNVDCPIPADSEQCERQLSSSSLQLKLFNGNPIQSPPQFIHKGKSSLSFDLDI